MLNFRKELEKIIKKCGNAERKTKESKINIPDEYYQQADLFIKSTLEELRKLDSTELRKIEYIKIFCGHPIGFSSLNVIYVKYSLKENTFMYPLYAELTYCNKVKQSYLFYAIAELLQKSGYKLFHYDMDILSFQIKI